MTLKKISQGFCNSENNSGEYRDTALKGFVFRVQGKTKAYEVHGRIKGTEKLIRRTIGKHNDPYTTPEARQVAAEWLKLMREGVDPNTILTEQRHREEARRVIEAAQQKANALTVRSVFEHWCIEARKTRDTTKTLYRQMMFKHLADWLDKPLVSITQEMVKARYRKVADKTVASANNTFRALRMLYNWAAKEYAETWQHQALVNPVKVLAERDEWDELEGRGDVIADHDLKSWLDAIEELPAKHSDYFKLLLLCGLRRDEAAELRWQHVDFQGRMFSIVNTKNGRKLHMPMTAYTENLLRRRKNSRESDVFVFPSSDSGSGHITDSRYYQARVTKESGVSFTPHTLRRTFATAAGQLLPEYMTKRLLNHINKGDVTQTHYVKIEVNSLREPLKEVESHILRAAGIDAEPVLGPQSIRAKDIGASKGNVVSIA